MNLEEFNIDKENLNIQPVLLGGDINCYSVARAFHEAYGVKSIAYGKVLLGATKDSKIIDFRIDDIEDDYKNKSKEEFLNYVGHLYYAKYRCIEIYDRLQDIEDEA